MKLETEDTQNPYQAQETIYREQEYENEEDQGKESLWTIVETLLSVITALTIFFMVFAVSIL